MHLFKPSLEMCLPTFNCCWGRLPLFNSLFCNLVFMGKYIRLLSLRKRSHFVSSAVFQCRMSPTQNLMACKTCEVDSRLSWIRLERNVENITGLVILSTDYCLTCSCHHVFLHYMCISSENL